jgi:hypothetical protein
VRFTIGIPDLRSTRLDCDAHRSHRSIDQPRPAGLRAPGRTQLEPVANHSQRFDGVRHCLVRNFSTLQAAPAGGRFAAVLAAEHRGARVARNPQPAAARPRRTSTRLPSSGMEESGVRFAAISLTALPSPLRGSVATGRRPSRSFIPRPRSSGHVQQPHWSGGRGVLHLDLRRPDAANRQQGRAVERKQGKKRTGPSRTVCRLVSSTVCLPTGSREDGAHGDAPPHRARLPQ